MNIEVTTDHNIRGTAALVAQVEEIVAGGLDIYAERLTRVIVHLSDTNGSKKGAQDKRCLLEARIENMPDLAVSHHDDDLIMALQGACEKMDRALGSAIGKLRNRRHESHTFSTIH